MSEKENWRTVIPIYFGDSSHHPTISCSYELPTPALPPENVGGWQAQPRRSNVDQSWHPCLDSVQHELPRNGVEGIAAIELEHHVRGAGARHGRNGLVHLLTARAATNSELKVPTTALDVLT